MPHDKVKLIHSQIVNLTPKRRMTLMMFLSLLLAGLALSIWMIMPYLFALVIGGILSILSQFFYEKLRSHHFRPKVASGIVTLGILLIVIIPISIFLTLAIKQGIAIVQNLSNNGTISFQSMFNRASHWNIVERTIGNPAELEKQIMSWVRDIGKTGTTIALGIIADFPNTVLQLVLASISCFFFLIDGPKLMIWLQRRIPLEADVRLKIKESFINTTVSVVWATLVTASVQSILMLISYIALGVPASFLAAGATFIFAWIPIVGSTPVWLTGAIYLYTQGMILKVILMTAFGLFIGIVDNFIRPIILKGRTNMHPLVSLVAIFGGVGMFGIMGVFVGPILVAVVISILQVWPEIAQRFGLLTEKSET